MGRLAIVATGDSPVAETSGLTTFPWHGGEWLAVVGDATNVIGWAALGEPLPDEWDMWDVTGAPGVPAEAGQFEAVAAAGEGRLLVLAEEPALVLLLDLASRSCPAWWELDVSADRELARLWRRDANSRGEGLVPLADGHLLVLKEKAPVLAIEFGAGPAGARPLGPGESWTAASAPGALPVTAWTAVADAPSDVSDAAVRDGEVWLLSDQDGAVLPLQWADGRARAGAGLRLDKSVDKPEGLAVTASGRVLVAMDRRKGRGAIVEVEAPF